MLSSCYYLGSWAVVCAPAVDRPLPLVADFWIEQSEFCLWPLAAVTNRPIAAAGRVNSQPYLACHSSGRTSSCSNNAAKDGVPASN